MLIALGAVTMLGLGTTGFRMAGRLLAAGFPLTVWNRSVERVREMETAGARTSPTRARLRAGTR
jgi:3-hydroxyisobutyrate dehydrogenase